MEDAPGIHPEDKVRIRRRPDRHNLASAAFLSLVTLLTLAGVASANPSTGWYSTGNKEGVRGYISQGLHSAAITGANGILAWMQICASLCQPIENAKGEFTVEKEQIGEYQGQWNWGSSPSAVRMYLEIFDACGDYFPIDLGVPSYDPEFFLVKYDQAGLTEHFCQSGEPIWGYNFQVKKDSVTSSPFNGAIMFATSGAAKEVTEIQGAPASPWPNNYFGCEGRGGSLCGSGNEDYGIEWFNNGSWKLAGTSSDQTSYECKTTYDQSWAFLVYKATPC
ncbi:MAG TPA: hypothetical protein VH371_09400 [Candidatus Limnocylindrales bacterium]